MQHPKILIVEDNPGDVQLIKEHFKSVGEEFDFTVAKDGEEAINILMEKKDGTYVNMPHLIILDLNLPKKNGKEVLKEIRQNESLNTIPVVIFSSSDAEKDIKDAYSAYANCYIVKPFDFDAFNTAIVEIWKFWGKTATFPNKE
jgi:two-component system, chemotaxis family, response regulator Rcp1